MSRIGVYMPSTGALLWTKDSASYDPAKEPTGHATTPVPDNFPDEAKWDVPSRSFLRDLTPARQKQWAAVKFARDVAQDGGCATPLGRVDTDPESRGKISGSVQMAMIAQAAGAPFEIAWTMQDNGTAVHDGPAMIAMGVAVGQHVAACHAEGLARRALIEAAEELEDIEAVPVQEGWPGAAG